MADWKDEISQLDIVDVAQKLGIQLAPGRRSPRLAICPFHNDTQPSLHLYQGKDAHYHCFTCHEHGDTVELVKQRQHVDFAGAIDWLASTYGLNLRQRGWRNKEPRQDIRQRAQAFWHEKNDLPQLKLFAQARKFGLDTLTSAGIVIGSTEAFLASLGQDRAALDEAVAAGLGYAGDNGLSLSLKSVSLTPFVRGASVLIPIKNLRARTVGFMARRVVGDGPKYLFTKGFKKSDLLYRGDEVRRRIDAGQEPAALDAAADRFDLFLVEGVFDALRLESLGLPAVALFGASISDKQVEAIGELAELALSAGRALRVHLFFDADKAGRRGMADALARLLHKGLQASFLVDVVGVDMEEADDRTKIDPDELLAGLDPHQARLTLLEALVPALDALAAVSLDHSFAGVAGAVEALDAGGSIILQNRLARRLQKLDWPAIWQNLAPDETTLGARSEAGLLSRTYGRLSQELERASSDDVARKLPEPFIAEERSADAALLHAMILARESTDSREYPVDVASWDRIEEGASIFLPWIEQSLARPKGPQRPYLAHNEAKDSGAPRLKCGPCPEDAIQQQYVLTELLRVRGEQREIAERIPAVRYWSDQPALVVTGAVRPQSAVSFAYQIDMRALEERPDRNRRRDMFRPFLDCWNSFILHIGRRIERMRSDLIYIARLDIKSFYDHVPRYAVERALDQALPSADAMVLFDIAPLFGAELDGGARRDSLMRWILDHSFGSIEHGYSFAAPADGQPKCSGSGAKGLPQGPALSSYLANIVLFELDAELEARVKTLDGEALAQDGQRACGGLYARYVDDIVIAARSPDDLRNLRSAIESKLEGLGLELNEKSEHLAPMSAEDARNWVVERRGAGFVGYGEADDQPSPAPDVRSSWADIPTLDRRTALSVLHWSALDDPEQTPWEEFELMLTKVAQADDLRAPDLGHILRRIILRAALAATDDGEASTCARFIQFFEFLLRPLHEKAPPKLRVRPSEMALAEALVAARDYCALLTGLERLILGSPESNPTFSRLVQTAIGRAKNKLLCWILNEGLLGLLFQRLITPGSQQLVRDHLGAQLTLQRAILEERAARAIRLQPEPEPDFAIARRALIEAPTEAGSALVAIGWMRTFAPEGLLKNDSGTVTRLLHAIAAEAQVAGGPAPAGGEILAPAALSAAMAWSADKVLTLLPPTAGSEGLNPIASAFRALAGGTEIPPPDWRMRTLSAFLALSAGPRRSEALALRPGLIGTFVDKAVILPLPPIADQPGVFCYSDADGSRTVHAILVKAVPDALAILPADLEWRQGEAIADLQRWSAELGDRDLLMNPRTGRRRVDDDLAVIADVFDGLVTRYGVNPGPETTLVHVFALIGPVQQLDGAEAADAVQGASPYFALAWRVRREQAEQLIFEQRGDGLAVQRSPHAGAEIWRIGQSVADLFAIPSDGAVEDHQAGLKRDRRLLQARLRRMAFSRLRGRWINPAQVSAALATRSVPMSLHRIVNALREATGEDDRVGPLALEFLLSGRAMRARMDLGLAVDMPGGWARFLETVGGRSLRAADDAGLFAHASVRSGLPRPGRALIRTADAISTWINQTTDARCRAVLSATALSFELAALRLEVKDLVLAILARFAPADLGRLAQVRPECAALGAFGELLLIEPRFGLGESRPAALAGGEARPWGYDAEWQVKDLFATLVEALGQRALPGRASLERISTAGWLTIISVIAGVIPFEMAPLPTETAPPLRPRLLPLPDPALATPLRALATELLGVVASRPDDDPDRWPWEVASALDLAGLRGAIGLARGALEAIQKAAGVVLAENPTPLSSLVLSDQHVEFVTAAGRRYRLPWWRCSLISTAGERIDRVETVPEGDRLVHPCSMLEGGDSILVVQLISESLGKITGLKDAAVESEGAAPQAMNPAAGRSEGEEQSEPQPIAPTNKAFEPEDSNDAESQGELGPQPMTVPEAAHEPPQTPEQDAKSEPPPTLTPEGAGAAPVAGKAAAGPTGSRAAWRVRRDRAWRARGTEAGLAKTGYGRVAILQYDFPLSYDPEKFPNYGIDGKEGKYPRVEAGVVDWKLSFAEHRRRQVLTAVLETCDTLGVEALVMPEYSAWPETITWMVDHCRQRGYNISIWAGTFRQQTGFGLVVRDGAYVPVGLEQNPDIRPMEAHLSVVFHETQPGNLLTVLSTGEVEDEGPIFQQKLPERIRHRPKKYPSIGMFEEFKPSHGDLTPLMAVSRSLTRIESFIHELVCSELFVFNGPLNWRNIADHLEKVAAKYKVAPEKDWFEAVVADARNAALVFSGAEGHKPRRSLLFVTCATSRDADYHYFAQSAYLASGIVTAFCNWSAPGFGGSCFIGAGGWETRGDGALAPNPYHGVTPGFLSNGADRGALAPTENALIIADIRPDKTVDDKPRSQTLGAPMRLVAHIPILEDMDCKEVEGRWDKIWCHERQIPWILADNAELVRDPKLHKIALHKAVIGRRVDLDEFFAAMEKVVAGAGSSLGMTAEQADAAIAAALSLAAAFDRSPAMARRAAAMAENLRLLPEPLPCPALVDWLVVDLDIERFHSQLVALQKIMDDLVKIKKDTVTSSELPPELKGAAWRWVPREGK
ncbi:CHC2 zinc finger domain-containing protein [Aquabacter sp. P-9]|uniref:CHC2 zinc finger domain-containing protein n=1 Tax=Aquabacter sediminis TaxID=3029197 RepID=UPI00237D44D5|nr:CHC2 zinc finger domain-containing protein [Aquabacter sp. P-9]MDE1568803.1 CHC2 zinc finger domain-containing protein [Aquabacter sp. P-9]